MRHDYTALDGSCQGASIPGGDIAFPDIRDVRSSLAGPDWARVRDHYRRLYKASGLHPLPIAYGTKACKFKRWTETVRKYRGAPESWWERRPDDVLGLMTGEEFEPGRFLFVIDIDVSDGKGGMASYRRLLRDAGIRHRRTATTRTSSGGFHLFYAAPFQVQNQAPFDRERYPGIDIKGWGGLVVAPPSPLPDGRIYRAILDPSSYIADVDPALLGFLKEKRLQAKAGPRARSKARDRPDASTKPPKPKAAASPRATRRTPRAEAPVLWPSPDREPRPGEVESLIAEAARDYPIPGPGLRNGLMLSLVASLVNRDVPDAAIRDVCLGWYDAFAGNVRSSRETHQDELESMIVRTRCNPGFLEARGRHGRLSEAEHLAAVGSIDLAGAQLACIASGEWQATVRRALGQEPPQSPQEGRGGRRRLMSGRDRGLRRRDRPGSPLRRQEGIPRWGRASPPDGPPVVVCRHPAVP